MFPDPYVADFCDRILSAIYGKDWMKDRRSYTNDVIKPWMVVDKL